MLRQQIHDEMIAAMKAQNKEVLETVRYLWSEIKRVEIDAKHELADDEIVDLLRKEVKKRKEAVEQMKAGGRTDKAIVEEKQLALVNTYLPAMLSKEEIETVVNEVVATGAGNFGAVMGQVMAKLKGKADGKMVGELVKAKFN